VPRLTDRHFAGLLGVRSAIAIFERSGEREARLAGATHAQHHVLLALRGHRDRETPGRLLRRLRMWLLLWGWLARARWS